MVLRKFLFCLFCISCFLCYFAHAVSNDVLEVKKTVSEDRDGNYIVSVGYKSVGAGRVQKVQIIDSYPEGLQLLSGEIVVAAKDPTHQEWSYNTYKLGLDIDRNRIYLHNLTVELELGGAQVSYVRLGETERETLITDSPTIKVDMKEQLLPKGGSLLDQRLSTIVIAGVALVLPVVAAIGLIPMFSHKKSKKSE